MHQLSTTSGPSPYLSAGRQDLKLSCCFGACSGRLSLLNCPDKAPTPGIALTALCAGTWQSRARLGFFHVIRWSNL